MIKNDAVLNEEIDPKLVRVWSIYVIFYFIVHESGALSVLVPNFMVEN